MPIETKVVIGSQLERAQALVKAGWRQAVSFPGATPEESKVIMEKDFKDGIPAQTYTVYAQEKLIIPFCPSQNTGLAIYITRNLRWDDAMRMLAQAQFQFGTDPFTCGCMTSSNSMPDAKKVPFFRICEYLLYALNEQVAIEALSNGPNYYNMPTGELLRRYKEYLVSENANLIKKGVPDGLKGIWFSDEEQNTVKEMCADQLKLIKNVSVVASGVKSVEEARGFLTAMEKLANSGNPLSPENSIYAICADDIM